MYTQECDNILSTFSKIVSEYDLEIPHSQTADKPMSPRGQQNVVFPNYPSNLCITVAKYFNLFLALLPKNKRTKKKKKKHKKKKKNTQKYNTLKYFGIKYCNMYDTYLWFVCYFYEK